MEITVEFIKKYINGREMPNMTLSIIFWLLGRVEELEKEKEKS